MNNSKFEFVEGCVKYDANSVCMECGGDLPYLNLWDSP